MKFRTERDGNRLTIWDDAEGVGLQFTEGEDMQAYTYEVIIKNVGMLSTKKGITRAADALRVLRAFAEVHYPNEFAPIADDVE